MPSPELHRVLTAVLTDDARAPATLDDAVELLDDLSDAELAELCGVETPGAPVKVRGHRALWSTSELRKRLMDEIDEAELAVGEGEYVLVKDVLAAK